jgi:FlaA1/EpsC-like NDP-sugar epimerase
MVGLVDDAPGEQGLRFDGVKVLGITGDIPELVKRHDIGVIFYAIGKITSDDKKHILTARPWC